MIVTMIKMMTTLIRMMGCDDNDVDDDQGQGDDEHDDADHKV
jgi:hypothetical protein